MKEAVTAKVVGMKTATRIHSKKLPESIKNAITFDVFQLKVSRFSGKTPIGCDLLLLSMANCPKIGVFQRSKGRGRENSLFL